MPLGFPQLLLVLPHPCAVVVIRQIWDAEGAGASNIGPMALGSVGWVMPGVKKVNGKFYGYRFHTEKGGLFLPDKRYSIHVPQLQEVRRRKTMHMASVPSYKRG